MKTGKMYKVEKRKKKKNRKEQNKKINISTPEILNKNKIR